MKKLFLVGPLLVVLTYGCIKAGCSIDTPFLCIAIIMAGYIASDE